MKQSVTAVWIVLATAWATAQQVGPKTGALVIVGGAMRDPAIVTRFIDLAGGPEAPLVIVPTAGEGDSYDQYWSGLQQFRENGARNLTVLHTRDPKVADTDAFVKPLTTARGVFFARRAAVAPRRCLSQYARAARAAGTPRSWRCDRWVIGRRDHPRILPGSRRYQRQRADGGRSHRGLRLSEELRHRSAPAPTQSPVRPDRRDSRSDRNCSASASTKIPRSLSRATGSTSSVKATSSSTTRNTPRGRQRSSISWARGIGST